MNTNNFNNFGDVFNFSNQMVKSNYNFDEEDEKEDSDIDSPNSKDKNDIKEEVKFEPFLISNPFEKENIDKIKTENISNFSFKFNKKENLKRGSNFKNDLLKLGPLSTNRLNNKIINIKNLNKNLVKDLKLIPLNFYYLKDDIHNLKYYFSYLNYTETFKNDDFSYNNSNILLNDYNSLILLIYCDKKDSHLFSSIFNQRLLFSSISFTNFKDLILFSSFNDYNIRLYNIDYKNKPQIYKTNKKEIINQLHNNENSFYATTMDNNFFQFDIRVIDYINEINIDNKLSNINKINQINNNLILNLNNETRIYDLRKNLNPIFIIENNKINNKISKIKVKDNSIYQLNKYSNEINIFDLKTFENKNMINNKNSIIDFEINKLDNKLYLITKEWINENGDFIKNLEFYDMGKNIELFEKFEINNESIRLNTFGLDNDILIQTNKNFQIHFSKLIL